MADGLARAVLASVVMVSRTSTLATLVLERGACASVLQQHRLDFCCDGHQTVEEAAERRGLDVEALVGELERAAAEARDDEQVDLRGLTTRELVTRAVSLHHLPLRRTAPLVQVLAAQTPNVPSALVEAVERVTSALLPHLEDESQVMFPALLSSSDRARTLELIAMAERDHRVIVERLLELREAAADYLAPPDASAGLKTLLNELRWLETDVLSLIHLETHVLQPRFRGADKGRS